MVSVVYAKHWRFIFSDCLHSFHRVYQRGIYVFLPSRFKSLSVA
jgi:hypothetical protein